MLVRIFVGASVLILAAAVWACGDDDDPVTGGGIGITPQATSGTLGTPPLGEPEDLFLQHLDAEFEDRDWIDDVRSVEVDSDGLRAIVQLDRNGDSDAQAFDEVCTAAAGYLMTDEWGIEQVSVEDSDGETVYETPLGRPQCSPV